MQLGRHFWFVADVRKTSFHGLHFTDRFLQAQLKGNIVPQNKHVCFDSENESKTKHQTALFWLPAEFRMTVN